MSASLDGGLPEVQSLQAEGGRAGGRGISARFVVLLVVSAGAVLWSSRQLWESNHPLEAAVRDLRSTDASVREAGVREISELGVGASGDVIRTVLPVVTDADAGVREAGADALGLVGTYAARSPSESDGARAAVSALMGLLKDRESQVRCAAAKALGLIVGSSIQPPPAGGRGRGRGGRSANVAASTPSAVVDPMPVVTALVDLLGDPDAAARQGALIGLRDSATRVLEQPPPPMFAAVEDESAANREMAISVLANFPGGLDPLMPPLLRHLATDEPSVRETCVRALNRIQLSALTPAVVPALIAGLDNPDAGVRQRMVSLLSGVRPDPRAVIAALIKVLREPLESDRAGVSGPSMTIEYEGPAQEAAGALGRIAPGTPDADEAIAALAEVVRSGPRMRRAASAEALGRFGKAAAPHVPALIAYLREAVSSKEPSVDGASAATALGRIAPGTPSAAMAVAALTDALKADVRSARVAVVQALSSFGPAAVSAIDALRAIEKNERAPHIREAAASALEAIEGRPK